MAQRKSDTISPRLPHIQLILEGKMLQRFVSREGALTNIYLASVFLCCNIQREKKTKQTMIVKYTEVFCKRVHAFLKCKH